jgi:excisionase family DNA binding protein
VKPLIFENLPNVLTVKELAETLKVHELTIKRALKSGKLKGFKVPRDWRISKDEVLQWINTK